MRNPSWCKGCSRSLLAQGFLSRRCAGECSDEMAQDQLLVDLRSAALAARRETDLWEKLVAASVAAPVASVPEAVAASVALAGAPVASAPESEAAASVALAGAPVASAPEAAAPLPAAAVATQPEAVHSPQLAPPRQLAPGARARGVVAPPPPAAATPLPQAGQRPLVDYVSESALSDSEDEMFVAHLKTLVCRLYRARNPEKEADVDELFKKYKGQEFEMYCRICRKYGEEPCRRSQVPRCAYGLPQQLRKGTSPETQERAGLVSRSTSASRSAYSADAAEARRSEPRRQKAASPASRAPCSKGRRAAPSASESRRCGGRGRSASVHASGAAARGRRSGSSRRQRPHTPRCRRWESRPRTRTGAAAGRAVASKGRQPGSPRRPRTRTPRRRGGRAGAEAGRVAAGRRRRGHRSRSASRAAPAASEPAGLGAAAAGPVPKASEPAGLGAAAARPVPKARPPLPKKAKLPLPRGSVATGRCRPARSPLRPRSGGLAAGDAGGHHIRRTIPPDPGARLLADREAGSAQMQPAEPAAENWPMGALKAPIGQRPIQKAAPIGQPKGPGYRAYALDERGKLVIPCDLRWHRTDNAAPPPAADDADKAAGRSPTRSRSRRGGSVHDEGAEARPRQPQQHDQAASEEWWKRRTRGPGQGNRDWWCESCHKSNFAKRQLCRFCSAQRPTKALAGAETENTEEAAAPAPAGAGAEHTEERPAGAGAEHTEEKPAGAGAGHTENTSEADGAAGCRGMGEQAAAFFRSRQ